MSKFKESDYFDQEMPEKKSRAGRPGSLDIVYTDIEQCSECGDHGKPKSKKFVIDNWNKHYAVQCGNCKKKGAGAFSAEAAIILWNKKSERDK